MISKKELKEMWEMTKEDDEYEMMTWGSREDTIKLIKEVRRLQRKEVKEVTGE